MYSREIEGHLLTFGVSGQLMMNGLVMYDHQTDSLWSQVTGRGVYGKFEGAPLEHVAALQTTWAAWTAEHPDTLVLDKLDVSRYASDPYASYYKSGAVGLFGQTNADSRLLPKEFVIGVSAGEGRKAYPFSEMEKIPIVNDEVGGQPVVVAFDAGTSTGAVFSRVLDGRELTFEPATRDGAFVLADQQTGTTWAALTGRALEGPLSGSALRQIPSISLFWFAWSDFHPETELYLAEGF